MADDKRAGGGVEPLDGNVVSNMEKNRRGSQATVDLNDNTEAKIKNPLLGLARGELLRDVEHFAHDKGLDEYLPILKKGALVAQDPTGFEDIDGPEALDTDELQALRDEILHKWRIPKILYLTIITCSIGAAVQGWDQTGSNGANLSFPTVFGIGGTSHHDTLLVGLVNSAPYIGASVVGSWLSDPLNNYLGRRGAIQFAAQFCIWPVIGAACSQTWEQLLVCRLLLGIGMGAKASTVPIFAAENSPAAIRGALVMSWQMWTAFGILLGTCANLAVGKTGDISWRLQLGSAFIPAVPLAVLIYFCPESPRWYIKKNRYQNAMKSLLRLRNHPIQAARDIYYIHAQLQIEAEIIGQSTYAKRFVELFTIPRVRRATLASFTVMIAQQMCGKRHLMVPLLIQYSQSMKASTSSHFTPVPSLRRQAHPSSTHSLRLLALAWSTLSLPGPPSGLSTRLGGAHCCSLPSLKWRGLCSRPVFALSSRGPEVSISDLLHSSSISLLHSTRPARDPFHSRTRLRCSLYPTVRWECHGQSRLAFSGRPFCPSPSPSCWQTWALLDPSASTPA
nr:hexose transporter [Colletotrichum truncatum]KAF6796186.1 hexose transporter [Colletotrichum truncatum]